MWHTIFSWFLEKESPLFEKDLMKEMSGALGNLTEAEKDKKLKSLQKLLDEEMKRRKISPDKKPKK
jgi:hypothetical protein